jgi:uncharacterized protein YjbJ (UPF0337 family)
VILWVNGFSRKENVMNEDDLDIIDGRRDELVGRIQARFGIAREEADKQVAEWEKQNSYTW